MSRSIEERVAAQAARLAETGPALLTRLLQTGGDYADLFYEHSVYHRLSLCQEAAAGQPRADVQRKVVEGTGLRVLAGAQAGFAATEQDAPASLAEAAAAAAAQVEAAGGTRTAQPITRQHARRQLPEDRPDRIAVTEKAALLQAAADAGCSLDERVRRVEVRYQDRVRRTVVLTSEGILVEAATLLLGLRVDVVLSGDGEDVRAHALAGGAYGFGHFFAHPPEAVARRAVERAQVLARARPLSAGPMPVVIAAGWGGAWLHEAAGHLLEADAVAVGASAYAGRLGTAVAASCVTLADDPTLPGGRGSAPFDDEGTPAHAATLVEQGVLAGFLTDRRNARALKLPCTGHGRRQDFRHPPLPRMTNLVLQPGAADAAALIADVQEGLYVATVGHGRVWPQAGRYAFDVLAGRRIEGGRCTAPVAGVRITGRIEEALLGINGVAGDFQLDTARGVCQKAGQAVPVSAGMPTVLVHGLCIES